MAKPQPGASLHRLVEHLERATHDQANVQIESPKRIPDKDTGRLREHDVVLTFTHKHHELVVAIECRDRSRKVGSPEVEQFYIKCDRSGIDRGIIVSSLGFTVPAVKKALAMNIGCLTLEEVVGFDWCMTPGIEISHREIKNTFVNAVPERQVDKEAKLFANDGTLIDGSKVSQLGIYCINNLPHDYAFEEQGKIRFRIHPPEFYVIDSNGDRVGVRDVVVAVTYEFKSTLIPFEFHQYFDTAKNKALYEVAIAPLDYPGLKGDFMIIQDKDKGGFVSFVHEKKEKKPKE